MRLCWSAKKKAANSIRISGQDQLKSFRTVESLTEYITLLTIPEYSRHRGCTQDAVKAAILAGRITKNADGTLDPEVADAEWQINTDSRRPGRKKGSINAPEVTAAAGRKQAQTVSELKRAQAELLDPTKLGKLSLQDARALKENYEAERVYIAVQKEKAKLMDRDEVYGEISKHYRVLRDSLLNIPSRVAGQVATLTEIADIQDVIAEEITAALEELSAGMQRIAEGSPQ